MNNIDSSIIGVMENILECFSSPRLQRFLLSYLPEEIKKDFNELLSGSWRSPKNLPGIFFEKLQEYPNHIKIIKKMIPALLTTSPSDRCSQEKFNDRLEALKSILDDQSSQLLSFDTFIKNNIKFDDDLYTQIIKEINITYSNRLFNATFILTRKLLENLVIDCLRKYFTPNVDNFFSVQNRMFLPFSQLIENFNSMIRKSNFISFVGSIPKYYVDTLKKFKDIGNSSAHSIFSLPSRTIIENNRDELNNLLFGLDKILKKL